MPNEPIELDPSKEELPPKDSAQYRNIQRNMAQCGKFAYAEAYKRFPGLTLVRWNELQLEPLEVEVEEPTTVKRKRQIKAVESSLVGVV